MRTNHRAVWALVALTTLSSTALAQPAAAPAPAPSATAPQPTPAAPPADPPSASDDEQAPRLDPAKKGDAEESFRRGLDLLKQDAWQAALAEFLRSRELYPTRTATNNAAYCLRRLGRFDEALDMYETVLREYPSIAADRKAATQKEVAELRMLVGTIDVTGAEPGASIVVNGRPRAEFPLIDPLRVSAGSHLVRVFKEGFQSFEATVDVAGGQTARVEAKMPALAASGRLKVTEKQGRALDVVVDGAVVGVTPWEGSLAIGEHVVLLRGDDDLGTPPTAAPIRVNDVTTLSLAAETLEASVQISVEPPNAAVRIGGVLVGRGIWDGRLRTGKHEVVVEADGFFPDKRTIDLERGEREELSFILERNEDADTWRLPSKIVLDISGGFALAPSFGGDVTGACADGCSQSLALGGLVMVHGAYELGSGAGFGLAAGFLQSSQSVENRAAQLQPVGLAPLDGVANDDLRLRGFLVGITGSMRVGEEFPVRMRLGAGALIGSVRDQRRGIFTLRDGSSFDAPELVAEASTAMVYVDPEVTIGMKIGDRLELGAGLQALILFPALAPTWADDTETPAFDAGGDGQARYRGDLTMTGPMVHFVPTLSARTSF